MSDDPQFDKKDFENVIGNLLKTKPLPRKQVKTSKKTKAKTVIPARSDRQPKPEK
jgi:hypothetical protein